MSNTPNSAPSRPVYSGDVFYWHYAWMIVTIIAIMQMVGSSIRMAFGVFIYPLSDEFGWSQGSITLAYALSSIVTALVSPLAGSLGDRFGARKSMMLGCTMFIGGMLLIGIVNQVWQFYLTFGVLLGVAQAVFLVPLIPSAMTWFRRHLGVGMGFLMAAWGLGPALTAPIMGLMIQQLGWRDTFWVTAAASALIMVVLIAKYSNRPSDRGLEPYGALPGDPPLSRRALSADRVKLFTKFMRHTKAYWNLSSIHFLGCVGHAVILVYIVPIAIEEGISVVVAAGLLTVLSGVSIGTRLATPSALRLRRPQDRHDRRLRPTGSPGRDALLDPRRVALLRVRRCLRYRLRRRGWRIPDPQPQVLRTGARWVGARLPDARRGPGNGLRRLGWRNRIRFHGQLRSRARDLCSRQPAGPLASCCSSAPTGC